WRGSAHPRRLPVLRAVLLPCLSPHLGSPRICDGSHPTVPDDVERCCMSLDEGILMARLLLRNGSIVDGTGKAAVPADLLVDDGRVAAIGPNLPTAADDRIIDV